MLLRRAHSLAATIGDLWSRGDYSGAQQWIILVRDILSELLAGIVDPNHPLARQQSDLYIFLSALLATAEQSQDTAALKDLREILEIEMISWEMLVQREAFAGGGPTDQLPIGATEPSSGGLDFSA
jgi:flagellin-specific chaperone FliS